MDDKGIGLRELTRNLGMSSHARLWSRLTNRTAWQLDEIDNLATALGLTTEELLSRVDSIVIDDNETNN